MRRRFLVGGCTALSVAGVLTVGVGAASATLVKMPTRWKETQIQRQARAAGALQPPPVPCPQNGSAAPCNAGAMPVTTLPLPGNMAYYGGKVQVVPHVYLVFWGWGQKGAFQPPARCTREQLKFGSAHATLKCDPAGAGKYMANFVYQMGGTQWASVPTQYYQTVGGKTQHITNPRDVLAGIWADDHNSASVLVGTSGNNKAGTTNTYTLLAREAARAVVHFHIPKAQLTDSNIVIVQPQNFSDPTAASSGYCAFHDMTLPNVEHNWYNGITPGIPYTNMPYILNINVAPPQGGAAMNACGENAINGGATGKLDGFSIVLGHEIEETVTDPGAGFVLGSGSSVRYLGGWYDTVDGDENGDKCAWVGEPINAVAAEPNAPGEPRKFPTPGALGAIKGNHGTMFPVQATWSNDAAGGAGWCAGAGTDLPF